MVEFCRILIPFDVGNHISYKEHSVPITTPLVNVIHN